MRARTLGLLLLAALSLALCVQACRDRVRVGRSLLAVQRLGGCDLSGAFVQRPADKYVTYEGRPCYAHTLIDRPERLRLTRLDWLDDWRALGRPDAVEFEECLDWTPEMERERVRKSVEIGARIMSRDWEKFCETATKEEIADVCKSAGIGGVCAVCGGE